MERNFLGWRRWDSSPEATEDVVIEDACTATSDCDDGFVCARVWRKVDADEASIEDIEDETDAENEAEAELEDLIEDNENVEEGDVEQDGAVSGPEDRAVFGGAWRFGRRISNKKCVRKSDSYQLN